jgi:hypothetical protein
METVLPHTFNIISGQRGMLAKMERFAATFLRAESDFLATHVRAESESDSNLS